MNLTRCENGHFYDAERFSVCPHCNQSGVSTVDINGDDKIYTMPLDPPTPIAISKVPESEQKDMIQAIRVSKDDTYQPTIGFFGTAEPVVGWLVAISGSHKGEDFKLKTGRNFIGRSLGMDIALTGDGSVSREKHAIILYEPKGNLFLVQPGDAKELFYLNDKVVLSAMEIAAYDVISLGETQLMFIPCCSEKFKWDNVSDEDKNK